MPRLLILVAAFLGFAASAAPLDLTTPEGQIAALRRIQCSDVDGKPVTFYFKGVAAGSATSCWSRLKVPRLVPKAGANGKCASVDEVALEITCL